MSSEYSFALQNTVRSIIVAVVIFLTSFFPSNPEKLTLDASAVTAQSVEMVFEVKNETGRVIDQPTVAQISRKTDEGWDIFYSNDVIYDENDYVLPGGTEAFRISVEDYYGKPYLDSGEYKIKVVYRLCEKDSAEYMSAEMIFTVK